LRQCAIDGLKLFDTNPDITSDERQRLADMIDHAGAARDGARDVIEMNTRKQRKETQ